MSLAVRTLRSLASTSGSTLAAIGTLTLGVAACSCVFTLINALLLKPLPYRDPGSLMALTSRLKDGAEGGLSWQDARDLLESTASIESAAVYRSRTWGYTDSDGRPPVVALSGMVTGDFFRVLGVTPVLGSGLSAEFERRGENRAIWLTYDFWMKRYHGDPAVVGRRADLNYVGHRIEGVLPEGFRFPMRAGTPEVYIPLDVETYCCARDARVSDAIARRKPGISMSVTAQELRAVARRSEERFATTNKGVEFAASDLQDFLAGQRRGPVFLLAAAVAMLMLVAALNAGGILLARAAARVREAAIKTSLGAGLAALIREQVAQGAAIGVAAGALGFGGASALLSVAHAVPAIAAALEGYSRMHALEPDWRVGVFCFTIAIGTAVGAGLAPVLLIRRARIEALLRAMNNASPAPVAVRARQALVIGQVACSVVLLGAGGLLVRSLWNILSIDRGFRTGHVISAGIGIPETRYNTDEKMIGFHDQVISKLKAMPGVTAAGGGAGLPLGPLNTRILMAGETTPVRDRARVDLAVASPELFSLLGIPLIRGRGFSEQDRWGAPFVALVNQAFAARHLAGRDPLGSRVRLGFYNGFTMKPWSEFEVTGVIGDTRSRAADKAAEPMVVLSTLQVPLEGFTYYVASPLEPQALVAGFREAVWSVDRNLQPVQPVALKQRRESGLEDRMLNLWLLGSFALIAVVLAAIGIGAAAAASVSESRREIGIRGALGATPLHTAARVVFASAGLAGLGLVLGLAALGAVSAILESQLYGVGRLDPLAIGAVAAILGAVILLACALPAWRAARVDPADVLRAS